MAEGSEQTTQQQHQDGDGGRRRRRRRGGRGGAGESGGDTGGQSAGGQSGGQSGGGGEHGGSGGSSDGGGGRKRRRRRKRGGGGGGGGQGGQHQNRQGGGGGGGGQGHRGGGGGGGKGKKNRRRGKNKGKKQKRLFRLLDELQNGISIDPYQRWVFEREDGDITTRVIDLIAPIGRGQRVLIVAPPKAGKTVMLKEMCASLTENHPEAVLIALLIDERPEEVTDFKRSTAAEVFSSCSDQPAKNHIKVVEQAMEKALDEVLAGKDVVVMLDSITRLARAQNNVGGRGPTMTGGLSTRTMEFPRRVFGAARKLEDSGSLTIIGTALVDTGSKMDNIIFEEFKGTGNTEIQLSRQLFEKRIFPTVDIPKSGTRKEEKLYLPSHLEAIHKMRRVLSDIGPQEAMEALLHLLHKYPTNEEALAIIAKTGGQQ